jgi:hypothetical protein
MLVGEEWVEVTLANLSSHGAMVRSVAARPVGTEVEIRRRGVRIIGTVVWAMPTRFGIKSIEAIDLPALMAQSELQPDRRTGEGPPTTRRSASRWMFWNG